MVQALVPSLAIRFSQACLKGQSLHLGKMQAVREGALGRGKESPGSDACPGGTWYVTAEEPGSFSGCGKSAKGKTCAEQNSPSLPLPGVHVL